ncbi:hypothetical protein HDU81_002365 [Chytriomyces hyalinus]|nr:hypothetical protein BJ741DRAFT_608943 [Chytriomyces cf. hyalinus JEL632]KAJ3233271.1 hypothetical protein HDU81_002365 [Chytriomyces hyalinus]
MPKIVSSSIVSASKDEDDSGSRMNIYYCLCGEFLLILDVKIDRLPRRQTDGAFILNTKKRTYKLNTVFSKKVVVKRTPEEGNPDKKIGFEAQNRHCCPKCGLFVCYDQKGVFSYILDGSLIKK